MFIVGFCECVYGQAKLLNPYGDGDNYWKGSNTISKQYLKARISYLCPAPRVNQNFGNSKFMRSFQRVPKDVGDAIIASGEYVRKTCLSISYNKNWIDDATSNYIDSKYPDIVYAYSIGNDIDGYDVYYYVSDDLSPNPTDNDDDIKAELFNRAYKLFQQGSGNGVTSYLETMDLSDWDFSNVTSLEGMFSGNIKLTDLNLGIQDLTLVNNIQDIFYDCKKLDANDIISIFSGISFDIIKMPGAENANHKISNLNYGIGEVETNNGITYQVSYKNNNGHGIDKGLYLTSGLLPIELKYFRYCNSKFIFCTASELNNDKFYIQGSIDGKMFYDICKIDGSGTKSLDTYYEYEYVNTIYKYFRLKQIDYNGEFTYSHVIDSNTDYNFSASKAFINAEGKIIYRSYNQLPSGTYIEKSENGIRKVVKIK